MEGDPGFVDTALHIDGALPIGQRTVKFYTGGQGKTAVENARITAIHVASLTLSLDVPPGW